MSFSLIIFLCCVYICYNLFSSNRIRICNLRVNIDIAPYGSVYINTGFCYLELILFPELIFIIMRDYIGFYNSDRCSCFIYILENWLVERTFTLIFVKDRVQGILKVYDSPYGRMVLGSYGGYLCVCDWLSAWLRKGVEKILRRAFDIDFIEGSSDVIERGISELEEYFNGSRLKFDLPVMMVGSDFQRRVWAKLCEIPYGSTVSYSAVAVCISNPKAVRAVANAIGANILSIFIPCHRVIGSDNSLTGYRGGIDAKRSLLCMESLIKRKIHDLKD